MLKIYVTSDINKLHCIKLCLIINPVMSTDIVLCFQIFEMNSNLIKEKERKHIIWVLD
jgi:hypothetical protein